MFIPKLIITDLDGTVLREDKTISEITRKTFALCRKAGIPIAIATARYITGARPFAEALHAAYQILTDGTLVYRHGTLIYANVMDIPQTNSLLIELKQRGFLQHIAIPTAEGLFRYPEGIPYDPAAPDPKANGYTKNDTTVGFHIEIDQPFPFPASKMVVQIPDQSSAQEIAKLCGCKQFRYRGEDRYTFCHPTAGKLDAIRHIANDQRISLNDIMVFGDDINDIEMIRECGYGVAMGNAINEVKSAADEITETNQNDGVAVILQKVLKQLLDIAK